MTPSVLQLFDDASSTCTYLLVDGASAEAVLIDPVAGQLERDLALLSAQRLVLKAVLETHVHADHVTSAPQIAAATGAIIAVPAACGVQAAHARHLLHRERIAFGASTLVALHTPGHTAGSTCFWWDLHEQTGQRHLFTGDTLLIGGCGRTDFQSGSAEALWRSITTELFTLPGDTVVWPGHDYQAQRHSTIAREMASNPRLANQTEAGFVALMNSLALAPPARMAESVPANLRLDPRER